MACSICEHKNRASIDEDLLKVSTEFTVSDIAKKYNVSEQDLIVHCINCSPMEGEEVQSLGRRIKVHEALVLEDTVNEYSSTLKALGVKIRSYINSDEDLVLSKMLTKSVADTYIGLGGEIRQSVKTLAELDNLLNGKPDSGLSGLESLAKALRSS